MLSIVFCHPLPAPFFQQYYCQSTLCLLPFHRCARILLRQSSEVGGMASGKAEPRQMLQEALQERGWTRSELAWALGYSTVFVESLLDNTYLSADLALRLEASLGISPDTWLAPHRDHDLWHLL